MPATNPPKQVSSSSSSTCLTMTSSPGEGPGDSNNEERDLGFRAALDSVKDRGIPTRLSRPRSLGGAVAWCCQESISAARALAALLSYASAVRTGDLGTYPAVCSKWDTLLGNNKKNRTGGRN
jgi:hypothetical protein